MLLEMTFETAKCIFHKYFTVCSTYPMISTMQKSITIIAVINKLRNILTETHVRFKILFTNKCTLLLNT